MPIMPSFWCNVNTFFVLRRFAVLFSIIFNYQYLSSFFWFNILVFNFNKSYENQFFAFFNKINLPLNYYLACKRENQFLISHYFVFTKFLLVLPFFMTIKIVNSKEFLVRIHSNNHFLFEALEILSFYFLQSIKSYFFSSTQSIVPMPNGTWELTSISKLENVCVHHHHN